MSTITLTKTDLLALADKIANHEHSSISKPAACNMLAATILGPKHDWSYIKNADEDLTSQRARTAGKQTAAATIETMFPIELVDNMHTDGRPSTRARLVDQLDGTVQLETDDGQIVWVEFDSGCLKTHVYNSISDGPASIYSKPFSHIEASNEAFASQLHDGFDDEAPAREHTAKLIGYQVDDPVTGENWGGHPSYMVLTLEQAQEDLVAAHIAGRDNYRLISIHEGDIEEPEFLGDTKISLSELSKEDAPGFRMTNEAARHIASSKSTVFLISCDRASGVAFHLEDAAKTDGLVFNEIRLPNMDDSEFLMPKEWKGSRLRQDYLPIDDPQDITLYPDLNSLNDEGLNEVISSMIYFNEDVPGGAIVLTVVSGSNFWSRLTDETKSLIKTGATYIDGTTTL